MAVPVDYQKFWTEGNQGFADAMPHVNKLIQDKKPGSPTLQRYIDEFEQRVAKGEPAQSVTADLMSQWENDIKTGVQHADVNVPNVGFNNGTPAVGNAPMAQPVAQAPNSFGQQPQSDMGGGSFNGITPSASAMGAGVSGGVSANAAPTTPAPAPQPKVNYTPEGAMPADNMGANVNGEKLATVNIPTPTPAQAPQPKIDLTTQSKSAASATPSKLMNRGEQEQAMSDIERVKKGEAGDNGLQFKQDKLALESKIKLLKAMSNRLSDREKMDLMKTLKTEGMTLQAQIAVMDATIRMKNAEDSNRTRQDANRIAANKASGKVDPRVQHLWARYSKAIDELKSYYNSLDPNTTGKPERVKQLKMVAANELHEYNKAAIENGLPERTAQDLKVREVYGDNDPNNKVDNE